MHLAVVLQRRSLCQAFGVPAPGSMRSTRPLQSIAADAEGKMADSTLVQAARSASVINVTRSQRANLSGQVRRVETREGGDAPNTRPR